MNDRLGGTGNARSVRFPRKTALPAWAYANRETVFHLTVRLHPEQGAISEPLRDALWATLTEGHLKEEIRLFAACLMPDHVHLLASARKSTVPVYVRRWKSFTTQLAWQHGVKGALWQPKMWDRSMRDETHFLETIEYIWMNPVVAGFVIDPADWVWSFISE